MSKEIKEFSSISEALREYGVVRPTAGGARVRPMFLNPYYGPQFKHKLSLVPNQFHDAFYRRRMDVMPRRYGSTAMKLAVGSMIGVMIIGKAASAGAYSQPNMIDTLTREAALALGVADRPWSLYNRRENSAEAIAARAQYDRLPIAQHNAYKPSTPSSSS